MSYPTASLTRTLRHTLNNGMTVLIYPTPDVPVVSVRGDLLAGAVHESDEQLAGLAVFTAAALIRGTQRRSFQQITAEIEARGCSVSVNAGMHTTNFSGKALPEDLPLVLELLAELLRQPTFPPHELDKLRGQYLMSLRESEQDTRYRASKALRELLFPAAHPYRRFASGTAESLKQISRADLVRFHQHYHPASSTIVIVGAVQPEDVLCCLEQHFGDWQGTTPTPALAPELPPVPPLTGVRREDVVLSGKVQTDIYWAVPGLRRTDPDFYAALIGNMVLGQFGMGGRLWHAVRERQGMAYSVSSGLEAGFGAGPWLAYAGVNPHNVERAIAAVLAELARFVEQGCTPEEVDDVRAYLTGSLALGLETTGGIASTLLSIERFGLGLDYLDRYPALIYAVTLDEINAVARRYLTLDRYVLATAGTPASAG